MPNAPITLITGAGSGIGRALALLLAARGHTLLLAGRTLHKLQRTQEACSEIAPLGRFEVHVCDLESADQARHVVRHAILTLGGLDTAVNCAGVAPLAPLADTDDATIEHAFRSNTFGPAAIMRAAWPHFAERGRGCIVNVSTYGTYDPFPGFFAYAASKAALDSMTRSCHVEGKALGMRAFCVNPGAVETPMLRALFSPDVLPASHTLDPSAVAQVIVDCIEGRREHDRGKTIPMVRGV